MKQIFIIEHLEPQLWPWCVIEYKHISKMVGRENLHFTNIKKEDFDKLTKFGTVFEASVKTMNLQKAAILDPASPTLLTPQAAQNEQYFIFGGILGDHPPKQRTTPELTKFMPKAHTYNIGKEQMSTDNAVATVYEILNGTPFENLKFQDEIEIPINKVESTIMPYRYLIKDKKPLVSKELLKFLKKQ